MRSFDRKIKEICFSQDTKQRKQCDHFAVRICYFHPICRVGALPLLIKCEARDIYISNDPPPIEVKLKILKEFKKYCPKCGAKIDYEKVKTELIKQ